MKCIIDGIDFYQIEPMRYYAPPASWSIEKRKENAINKIFSSNWYGSQKRDGIMAVCGKNPEGEIFLRPRSKNTKGEFVNKVDWVPQFHDLLNALDNGTVLLGEIYLPRDEQAKTTTSIMNCLLKKSLARQSKEEDKLHLYVFDILADRGESYLNMKAIDRFLRLDDYSKSFGVNFPYVEWAKYYSGKELWDLLQNLLADGYEGVVITYGEAPYEPGKRSSKVSLKIKKELQDTIDCIIIGANPPTRQYSGKEIEIWPYWFDEMENEKILASEYLEENHITAYAAYVEGAPLTPVTKNWFYGWAGSLKLGAYKNGTQVLIGNLSGVTDEIKEHWQNYLGKVCEVAAMEIMESESGYGLRHPKFVGWRDDIDAHDCTWERIFG